MIKHKYIAPAFLIIFIGIFFLLKTTIFLPFAFFSALILFMGLLAYGSFRLKANYFLDSIHKGKNEGIILTFDDGPDPETTPMILDLLKKENLKATFFVIGMKAVKNPELLDRMILEGHTVGNHSFSHHKAIAFFSHGKLEEDLSKCSRVIREITGHNPVFFRPPFGVTNPKFGRIVNRLGMKSIGWTVRSFDTIKTDSKVLAAKICRKTKPGSILLFHDTRKVTVEALPEMLAHFKKNNLAVIPIHQAL